MASPDVKEKRFPNLKCMCAAYITHMLDMEKRDKGTLLALKKQCQAKYKRAFNCIFVNREETDRCEFAINTYKDSLSSKNVMNYEDFTKLIAEPSGEVAALLGYIKSKLDSYDPEKELLYVMASEDGDTLVFEIPLGC